MNKLICFPFLLAIILVGCTGGTNDVSKLVAERDSFKEASLRQQQELNNLNAFVGAVSNGLDSIAMMEGYISGHGPEGTGMTREQMKQGLADLADLLARQKSRIAMLEDSLKIKGSGAEGLHNIVAHLNQQLESKEKMISQLRSEVNGKNADIAHLQTRISTLNEHASRMERKNADMQTKITTLNEDVERLDKKTQVQQQALVTQSNMMNECYFKIGTKKQLKQAGILDGKKLNASNLTPGRCVKVDIRQFRELTLNSKKPKILTTMPHSAYTIVSNGDGTSKLTITNPTAFWSASNYLVILLD